MIFLITPFFKTDIQIIHHFDQIVAKSDFSSFTCPSCHCIGHLYKNTSYQRYYIHSHNASVATLNITVLKCENCNHFHAILPYSAFPFYSYSYSFVLKTLSLFYFSEFRNNKSKVCNHMHISRDTLNRWLSFYSKEQTRHEAIVNLLNLIHLHQSIYHHFLQLILDIFYPVDFFLIFNTSFYFAYAQSNHLAN